MRINIIHMGFLYSGGGERVVLEQTHRLRERGHEVKLFSPIIRWQRSFPDRLREVHPERIVPPFPFPFPFREASAMLASSVIPFRFKEIADCDVLLCHSQPSMWIGYQINMKFETPYVGYLHQLTTFIHKRPEAAGNWASKGDFLVLDGLLGVFGRRVARQLDRLCHLHANRLIFNSNWTRSLFEKEYGVSGDVCYPAGPTFVHKHDVSSSRSNMIITASRHYPWKRIDIAFQVLKQLDKPVPLLVVAGEFTPHTIILKQIAKNMGLTDKVNFTGFISDEELSCLYSSSLAYVQTSIREPFGLCVHPDTQIFTRGGVKRAIDIERGDDVISVDGQWHTVYAKRVRPNNTPLIGVVPWSFNIPTLVTRNHPCYAILREKKEKFKTATRKEPKWVAAHRLKKGDLLVYPTLKIPKRKAQPLLLKSYTKGITENGTFIPISVNQYDGSHRILNANKLPEQLKLTESLAYLFGLYVAEGYALENGVVAFAISQKEEKLTQRIKDIVKSELGLNLKIRNRENGLKREIYMCSSPLARMLRSLFGTNAREKHFPTNWLTLPNNLVRCLLEGLFMGDGCIYDGDLIFRTASSTLANQVKFLLLKLRRFPFSFRQKGESKRKNRIYDFLIPLRPSGKRKSKLGSAFVFLPIRNVETVPYEGNVVDLGVEGASSFCGESILLHNSPLEAQSCGTPAVVWGDAGVKETVLDGETGFHAQPYDVGDFAAKLQLILKDEVRWRKMSKEARIWAGSFTWDKHVDTLEGILDEERR